jgi:hypothetical protein
LADLIVENDSVAATVALVCARESVIMTSFWDPRPDRRFD